MALFKDATAIAAAQTAAQKVESAGIDLHLPYRPTDMVWTIRNGRAVQKRVIKVTTKHRSLISSGYKPVIKVTVVLEDGTMKDGSEAFMSKAELIAATAAVQIAAPTVKYAGIDLHLPYRPTDMVWTIQNGRSVQKRVIEVTTEHRSLIGSGYNPLTKVTVALEDGTMKDGGEVFMSNDELIQSL